MTPNLNFALGVGVALAFLIGLRLHAYAVASGWIATRASRKLAHVSLGTLLLLSWLLYAPHPTARYAAATPAVALIVHFAMIGLGFLRDPDVVQAATRSGATSEFLRGPLLYVAAFTLITVLFWRTSPVGVAALTIMVFGDGLAEPVGKTLTSPSLPWNRDKSLAGSIAVLGFGWVAAAGALWLFGALDHVAGSWSEYLLPLLGVAAIGALAESLPIGDVDNVSIPLACSLAGLFLL